MALMLIHIMEVIVVHVPGRGRGGRCTLYNDQYGEVLPERDTFFSLSTGKARGFYLLNYMKG